MREITMTTPLSEVFSSIRLPAECAFHPQIRVPRHMGKNKIVRQTGDKPLKRILIISFVLLYAALSVAAQTQEKRLDSSPQSFRTFFSRFKSAVGKSDKTQVAALSRFPFKYGFDAGDEGTMTRLQFLKRFKEVFGDRPREFLSEKNPLFSRGDDGSYMISTEDAAHLIFVKSKGTFKFTAYIVEP